MQNLNILKLGFQFQLPYRTFLASHNLGNLRRNVHYNVNPKNVRPLRARPFKVRKKLLIMIILAVLRISQVVLNHHNYFKPLYRIALLFQILKYKTISQKLHRNLIYK